MNIKKFPCLAMIVKSFSSKNTGKIVMVERPLPPEGVILEGIKWEPQAPCEWVVISQGSPLAIFTPRHDFIKFCMTRVYDDDCLRPLLDCDDSLDTYTITEKESCQQ